VKRQKNVKRSDREIKIAIGKYGLKPAEALLANKVVVVEGQTDVTLLRTLVELKTGITPDRQDILIVSAGGKGPVSDLAGFLCELGVNWQAFFDWDATESTSTPLFRDGLLEADIESLRTAATTIRAKLRNLTTKASKATKIVDSMLTELANPPPARATFSGSILDAFIRKHSLMNTDEITALKAAVGLRQPQKATKLLSLKNIWLWSGSIEEVILRSQDAENDADDVLRRRGALSQAFPSLAERRVAITKLLHGSAHEPEVVRDVVETLWHAGRFDRSEVKSAMRFLLG
jgi:predicted ATP-dependent endonuclease of OLD family